MSEKYIDLEQTIIDANDTARDFMCSCYDRGVEAALEYFDEHPDQVPGRTITASEFDEAVESCITEDATVPPHTFAALLGVVCVPDPEPTNAQKIATEIDTYMQDHGWGDNPTAVDLAAWLSDRGVKAPGGDE